MKDGDRIELVVDGTWIEKCGWTPHLLDPGTPPPRPGTPVVALRCTLVDLDHPAGVVTRTDGRTDEGRGGFEIFVPWSSVVAIRAMA